MSQLLVRFPLPDHAVADGYAFALSHDGQGVAQHGMAAADSLPLADTHEVIGIVPVQALSWHALQLPKGSLASPARTRLVLEGLLEEQLLDDMETLHCALQPEASVGQPVWVCCCRLDWLQQHLEQLRQAGCEVQRLVPECAPLPLQELPDAAQQQDTLQAIGDGIDGAWWLRRGHALSQGEAAPGLLCWPLPAPGTLEPDPLLPGWLAQAEPGRIQADAAVAQRVEQLLQQPVQVRHPAERWLESLSSGWNLSQFSLANQPADRWKRLLRQGWQRFLQAPQWQATRWGLIALLLVSLLGLNLLAWQAGQRLEQQKADIDRILTSTFPHVKLVVDAPKQMQREVSQLQQQHALLTGHTLEGRLAAVVSHSPEAELQQLEWDGHVLRLKGLALSADQSAAVQSALADAVVQVRQDGNDWLLETRP